MVECVLCGKKKSDCLIENMDWSRLGYEYTDAYVTSTYKPWFCGDHTFDEKFEHIRTKYRPLSPLVK